jgi:hypothetical protein
MPFDESVADSTGAAGAFRGAGMFADDEDTSDFAEVPAPSEAPSVTATPTPLPTRSADPGTETKTQVPMSKPWFDLFDSEKISGLVSSSDIMEAQEKRLEKLKRGVTDDDLEDADEYEYDGPPKTGAQLGDIVRNLGMSTSLATIVDDVQDALYGSTADLTSAYDDEGDDDEVVEYGSGGGGSSGRTSVAAKASATMTSTTTQKTGIMDVLTRGNRLRGFGILLMLCAAIGMCAMMLLPGRRF